MESNNATQHLSGEAALTKVRDLLKNFRSAMMVTIVNGKLHSRPMGVQGKAEEFNGVLWFFSDRESGKIEEIEADAEMSLLFQSDSDCAYMHLLGKASVTDDLGKKKELFTPLLKTWFPEGLNDPRMTLIRFEAERGDFWDSPGGMLQVLAAFTKSVVTGKPAQGGEMGDVRL